MQSNDVRAAVDVNAIATLSEEATRLRIGTDAKVQQHDGGKPFMILPTGVGLTDVEKFFPSPVRTIAAPVLHDVASFIDYVKRFKTENTVIFAKVNAKTGENAIGAIFDYHAADKPAWGEHTARLALTQTPSWSEWIATNKRKLGQEELAEFIESHIPDIGTPPGATLLELVTNLSVNRSVTYLSNIRLQSGAVQFTYEATEKGDKGVVTIPESFTLGLRPFEGTDPYKLDAKLRFRLNDGALSLWFELVRPEDVVRDAFDATLKAIQNETGITVWSGAKA